MEAFAVCGAVSGRQESAAARRAGRADNPAPGSRLCVFAVSAACAALLPGAFARGAEAAPAPAGAPAVTNRAAAVAPAVLPEVVVTASRVSRGTQSEPWATHRIEGAQGAVQKANRTTPDSLEGLPSVLVQKTAYGQGSPYLRGFTGFRTLALVDGVRLNNSAFRDGPNQYWNTIDSLSVDRYELVMGPGSVLYGSDAVGGTMNALPVMPPEWSGEPAAGGSLYYRGSTAERSNTGRLELGGRASEDLGFVGGYSIKDFGDLEGGDEVGKQKHTGYDEQDFDAKATYDVTADTALTLAHQGVRQDDAWRTHRTVYGIDWEGLTHGDDKVHSFDQARDLTYARLRSGDLDGLADAMELTLSRHAQSEDLYRVKKDSTSERQGFDVTTWGGALQLESGTAAGEWVYGAEWYHDVADSYLRKYRADGSLSKTEIQGPIADDATYDTAGAFAQDTVTLLNGGLDVIPGLRYTYVAADADRVKDPVTGGVMSIEDDWQSAEGSVRVLAPITPDRRHVAYAGVSQGFRAPNLSDLTRYDTARSNEIETPSPDLDPERYLCNEVGLKSRTGVLTSRLSYYYTAIDGMIVRTPTGNTVDGLTEVTKMNAGDGYVQGLELSENYRFAPQWSTWVSASWMEGKVDSYPTSTAEKQRDYISRLMPPTAQVGLRWEASAGKYWCEAVGDAADKADKLSADDKRDTQRIPAGGTPGYAVCHVRAGVKVSRRIELALAVENVFNEDYRIHGSGVNEPGRNGIVTARCNF